MGAARASASTWGPNHVLEATVLRVTLDNMDQGIIMTDAGGRVRICNKRAIDLLDLPPALMASHPLVEEMTAYQARHGEFDSLITSSPQYDPGQGPRVRTRPNGTVLEIRSVPLPGGGVVCTFTDVTQRRDDAEHLRVARDAAEAAREVAESANRAKSDFLATMSHEIRTPLNAIIGFSELMADSGRLEPEMRRQVDLIRSSGQALLTLVDDILDFSKVEAGKIVLFPTSFSLKALMENCVAIVRGDPKAKALVLDLKLDSTLPDVLIGDEARLRQVVLNLLNNAVKFTPRGMVTLVVKHEGSDSAGEALRICVRDTGIGIAKNQQHRLFETFSQVDGSIAREYGGTGLGLAICRRLVTLMGGTIGVESEAGAGSEFWFRIKLPSGRSSVPGTPGTTSESVLRRGRLLLVEDVVVNQTLAQLVLEAAGHVVDVVGDGASAFAAVRDRVPYDLVLMDVQMKGMDGLMATRLIRGLPGRRGSIPIIAMTANVFPDQVRRFHAAGMNDCIGKPFKRSQLYATIDRWLALDTATYDELVDLLGEAVVNEVLGNLGRDLRAFLALAAENPQDRSALSHAIHKLVPAVGMIGLRDLASAFEAILAFEGDEAAFAMLIRESLTVGGYALATIAAKTDGPYRQSTEEGAARS
jgi:signal transduction histidine kinase/DNA-binding NarL/FixJ family response regulator